MLFDPLPLGPLEKLRRLQAELLRMVDELTPARSPAPAFALYARDDDVLLRSPLPGLEAPDVKLEIDRNVLTVSGRYREEPEDERAIARHLERPRGPFSRSLHLPFEIDPARVRARLERGVLEVEIPRLQRIPPVTIEVLGEAGRN